MIGWSWSEPPRLRWSAPHLFDDWIELLAVATKRRERNNNTRDKGKEREEGPTRIKGGGWERQRHGKSVERENG